MSEEVKDPKILELQKVYTESCTRLGDSVYRVFVAVKEVFKQFDAMLKINNEAAEINAKKPVDAEIVQ